MISARWSKRVASLVGLAYGIIYTVSGYWRSGGLGGGLLPDSVVEGLFTTCFLPFFLHLHQRICREKILVPLDRRSIGVRYPRFEPYTYLLFLIAAAVVPWIGPSIPLTIACWVLLALIQTGLFVFLLDEGERGRLARIEGSIAALFLVSGFSALIYQVVWQRALFTTFGVNTESVTVIVSVFMFGLGIGSLAGGYLQERYQNRLLRLFLLLEVCIGLFGLCSLGLIREIGHLAGTTSTASLVLWVYALLGVPTLLMGATLPILVAFLQRYFRNIGKTVGLLYAFNTVGSGIAAFLTVQVLFVFLGQQATILVAAACNFLTAALVFATSRRLAGDVAATGLDLLPPDHPPSSGVSRLPYALTFGVLFAIGYISLSQEILWFRLLGFMTANRPQVFGLLLAAFLFGVAQGALRSKRICESGADPYIFVGRELLIATVVFYLSVPVVAQVAALFGGVAGVLLVYLLVGVVAFLTGGILPLLIHLGVRDTQTQSVAAVAWLYFANIMGATLGPLLTGFFLLDHFGLAANIAIIAVATLVLLHVVASAAPRPLSFKLATLAATVILGGVAWQAHDSLYDGYLEKLQFAPVETAFKYRVENRSGVITVAASSSDIMFGNGIYDGRFNTDVVANSNLIDRAYMIAAMHRRPQNVLEIGLSTGSWARVIADYRPLKRLTIVEINKGYPDLMRHYPDIGSVLDDPRVNLVIDDGRRWLRRYHGEKFDFIVMNSTFHWRDNATNLLSTEFLQLCKEHLAPSGVIYYNTTGSPEVVYTAARNFEHVTMVRKFVAASDSPFDMSSEEKRANLLEFSASGGGSLFALDGRHRQSLDELVRMELRDIRDEFLARQDLLLVTDDNMAVEFKAPHY